jgi:hypothetical protein
LFVVFLLLDACSALARCLWKTQAQWRKHAKHKRTADDGAKLIDKQAIVKMGQGDSTQIQAIGMIDPTGTATIEIKQKAV